MSDIDNTQPTDESLHNIAHIGGMYESWFLDYASYVILERAVPSVEDGLKPVQRRILHAMKELDDGRFNKVANIIGTTMQFHPHGDASIGDAVVNLGQKDLLIDTQGNWGDVRTGDDAAAARYIEARLSKFALDVAYNPKTTSWQVSYDGRKNEPLTLPMKFPLLLAQGAEGIAVGLSTKILPHNFNELIDASIKYLRGRKFELYPDFMTGGMIDVANYNDGKRGGKVRVRAHIEEKDKKTLIVKDVPYGVTTTALMESIVKANDTGKIKIKKVVDNTAKDVEIEVQLAPGISPDITIDALYAFTDCEISVSPNACVIVEDKPRFITVSDLLRYSAEFTKDLLKRELEIKLGELNEKWHYTSLEKIFFEKQIYKELEEKHKDWDAVIAAIDKRFVPYKKNLKREIMREDIVKLTEKPVRRIYRLDINELNDQIKAIDADIKQVKHDLANLVDFTVAYYEGLQKKYGKGRERITEIKTFDTIQVQQVAMANTKIYVNRVEGFVGTSLKKDEFIADCSDLDNLIIFRKDGKMLVTKVADKTFVGKDIIHIDIFRKGDERTTYNMIYVDGKSGISYAKRFNVTGITLNKEYDLTTKGEKNSKVHYFTANPNGEAEVVSIRLSPNCAARNKEFDLFFETIAIKGRNSMGNQVTKYPIRTVKFKEAGVSTLAGQKLWYDDQVGRLNTEERGVYIGSFEGEDKVFVAFKNGTYELTNFELINRYDPNELVYIEKFNPEKIVSAIYFDADKKQFNAKRFKIETQTLNNKFSFIKEGQGNYLEMITTHSEPVILLKTGKKRSPEEEEIDLAEFVEVTGWKTVGTRIAGDDLISAELASEEEEPDEGNGNPQGELF
ncbi:DNA gyrase/topoisomerase IV subunit A [Chitinophaga sancti]|uniref:DNA gyrase/topoisomerase IV subunit A n=1 Tax=Chitinophaga sancti TaxID=1004 RepID=A0A1K1MN29_9BACT|nr:DNA gyrase/topoisomerase IV subunit A [Chitinophaga sancti]WQD62821.1 DNA gyrase/topoisomerase IV subunit A [Chitinophaga sancti]WQG91555.1 DNA gyrase/topoisomerase IV subunit A [Chitinophaga sancti]SFW24461.1 topoisomerase-4 subunit A [Chitinophaga sancti]